MHSPITLSSPVASFDEPIRMWLACHERVRRFSSLLQPLSQRVDTCGSDAEAQTAAHSIRRYFNEAAPRHHEDEEIDLFPRLLEGSPLDSCDVIVQIIDRLEIEHLDLMRLWTRIDSALMQIMRGEPAVLEPVLIDRFTMLYRSHLECEENMVLPALGRSLTESDLRAIGCAMAKRRGINWESPQ